MVWLRANPRPVWVALAAQMAGLSLVWLVVARSARLPPFGPWTGRAVALGLVAVAVAVVWGVAARWAIGPRLERRGDRLRVRFAAGTTIDIPVADVECFFLGSDRVEGRGPSAAAAHRVGTLVMRIAERAAEGHAARIGASVRPAWAPWMRWARWQDGAIVFDGRWCEPLDAELGRRLSGLLVAARRESAGSADGGPGERRP